MKGPGLPHRAVVTVTGWATPVRKGVLVGGLAIRTGWRPEGETRVTVRAYPRTAPDGSLRDLFTYPRLFQPAQTPNGTSVSVTGQLLKLDRGEGVIRVKVCPSQASDLPFVVTLHATGRVLDLDPATFHVTVTGRVLRAASGLLLAESVTPVHAPVPARWHRWRPKRRPPRPFVLDLPDGRVDVTLEAS
ncbi:hypothetical protein DAETH_48440 (plasmid) [Deinococcus aetherius]|uniref:Uncharacterized protein n=1 Tax=Deinococcus aetherius TaxID=200252 RepID=A0ABM8AM17_9DEIO|nr:hypothetical protein [Deinococcus aetherius]BDP44875.1 hypothetical protein DAETH_48440 [Deinococcus aetherius]